MEVLSDKETFVEVKMEVFVIMETLSETFLASTSRKWFPVKRRLLEIRDDAIAYGTTIN